MRFLYFYLMRDAGDLVREAAPRHAAYWHGLSLGGPFADRSGGLITFDVPTADEAERLVADDPFVLDDLLTSWWLKEWHIA
jgi:uncharacterized protein YciI